MSVYRVCFDSKDSAKRASLGIYFLKERSQAKLNLPCSYVRSGDTDFVLLPHPKPHAARAAQILKEPESSAFKTLNFEPEALKHEGSSRSPKASTRKPVPLHEHPKSESCKLSLLWKSRLFVRPREPLEKKETKGYSDTPQP